MALRTRPGYFGAWPKNEGGWKPFSSFKDCTVKSLKKNRCCHMAMGQNLVPLVNIKIAGKWVFTPLTLIIIDFDTHPYILSMAMVQKKHAYSDWSERN